MPEVSTVKEPKPVTTIAMWNKKAAKTGVGNAPQFLRDTRAFLLSAELQTTTKPILDQLDQRRIFPSQAIPLLFEALAKHESKTLVKKAEINQARGNFIVQVFDRAQVTLKAPNGILVAIHRSERGDEAEHWADRYLSERSGAHCYATIESKVDKTRLTIERIDAIARMYPKKTPAATVPTVKVSADRLSFGVGGQYNKPVYFSRG